MSFTPEQLSALRQEYTLRGLRRSDLDSDPLHQFHEWLQEALTHGILEPNAMVFATVDAEGQPWSRVVLLKGCDEQGFTFFTNYKSHKARQLAHEPRCALTFFWDKLQRQVNVTGRVSMTSREESGAYFKTRPLGSRLGAWASRQSEVVADRAQLESQLEAVRQQYAESEPPLPPDWGGYRVSPASIEFWQGRESRLHDRLRYVRSEGTGWKIERLSP